MQKEFCFFHPSPIIIAGPTGSGKTKFIEKIIIEKKMQPFPQKIYYCYSEWQKSYNSLSNLSNVEFLEGLPSQKMINDFSNSLLILDDLINETKDDDFLLNIFTKWSHHKNISVILVTQNIFNKGKILRSVHLNTHYLVLFNNPRDKSQIIYLSRQMYPHNSNFLVEVYNDACNTPFGYLIIDLKQTTENNLRVQTGIFLNEDNIVYIDK